ncbi:uncharacterized protein LOC141912214 [Tubulanus polymorphus]|uniref:uncharacterized protein LOC141912214 n=1 Tax=Tubulanus polymorphus TaxID=672921 RepID=UPI003DA3A366
MKSGSCTHTKDSKLHGKPLWWKVHLDARYTVTSVILVNRNTAASRLKKFKILVTTDESPPDMDLSNIPQNTICAEQEAQMNSSEVKEFFCPGHMTGNTVIVTKSPGTGALSLCEVEVYGVKLETNCTRMNYVIRKYDERTDEATILETFQTCRSRIECAAKCSRHTDCKGITYQRTSGQPMCRLFTTVTNSSAQPQTVTNNQIDISYFNKRC